MKKSNPGGYKFGDGVLAAIFFGGAFLYAWLRVEPALRYWYSCPVFLGDDAFLRKHLTYPGGPLEYAAALLAQGDYYNWLGAISFILLSLLTWGGVRCALRPPPDAEVGHEGPNWSRLPAMAASFVPPLVFLLLWNVYDFPGFRVGLGYLLALGFYLVYGTFSGMPGGIRLGACWLFAIGAFYLGGTWPCLLLVSLCMVREVGFGRWWLAGGCLLSGLVVPGWLHLYPGTPPAVWFQEPGAGWVFGLCLVLFIFLPVVRLLLFLAPWTSIPRTKAPPPSAGRGERVWLWHNGLVETAILSSLLIGGLIAAWRLHDEVRQKLIRIDRWAAMGQWEKIAGGVGRQDHLNPAAKINLVRALYHTGRLGDEYFAFDALHDFNWLPGFEGGQVSLPTQSAILCELGQVNVAERFAHESLSCEGERPETLKLLARVNVLKGRPEAARVFLNVLGKIPFHKEYARQALACLDRGGGLPETQELAAIRAHLVATDLPGSTVPFELLLRQLCHGDPKNRMAHEFLMVQCLVRRQLAPFLKNAVRLPELGFKSLPRHFEEAILLARHLRMELPRDLPDWPPHPEIAADFARFAERMTRVDLNSPADRQSMFSDFGHTYWLYYFLHASAKPPSTNP